MSPMKVGMAVLEQEARALLAASERLSEQFVQVVDLVLKTEGHVVVTGLGKSGHIGAKIAATLASTGTPSFFLHASEAMHGDFGMLSKGSCLLAITYGGETREVLAVAKFAQRLGVKVIGLVGNPQSSLAKLSDFILDGRIDEEADHLGLAPTSSSTVALGIGDALAVALMRERGFGRENFARLHPEGSLGRNLSLVDKFMHPMTELPRLQFDSGFKEVLEGVTRSNFGVAGVFDEGNDHLLGCVTDGDLRRALLEHTDLAFSLKAEELMTPKPKVVYNNQMVIDAINLMEQFKITSLFVLDHKTLLCAGLVRLHDLMTAKII